VTIITRVIKLPPTMGRGATEYGVIVPDEFLLKLRWVVGDAIEVTIEGERITGARIVLTKVNR
jgi:hypothetical protein